MTFSDDMRRFEEKNKTAIDFKVCLMTFESIRKELMKRFKYAVVHCGNCSKTYLATVAADGVDKALSSPLFSGSLSRYLSAYGLTDVDRVPAPPLFGGECDFCGDTTKVGLIGAISAVECNPTVVNQGTNDLVNYNVLAAKGRSVTGAAPTGEYCATLVYKFALHLLGVRAEPVYLVAYSKKVRWNYNTAGVAVCRFGTASSPAPFFFYDLDADPSTHLLLAENRILAQIESLLLTK